MSAQHVMLESLQNWVSEHLDSEAVAEAWAGEPESYVFFAPSYEDQCDEEYGASVAAVSDNDLYKKLTYWQGVVNKAMKGAVE